MDERRQQASSPGVNMSAATTYAYSCLLGLLVGDAIGAPLEFLRERDPVAVQSRISEAMSMRGGGALNVAPGQGTDDSELAIHLLRGLSERPDNAPDAVFPQEAVAQEYMKWYVSGPFDMGKTCGSAFRDARDAYGMRRNALRFNSHSQSNGSLMRVAPLAIWACAHGFAPDRVADMARAEARLSHPHPVCQDANAVYCLALTSLLRPPASLLDGGVADRASRAIRLVDSHIDVMHGDVRRWFADSQDVQLQDIVCTSNIGHVKHAFTLAFHFLRRCTSFEEAMRETCAKLGDSDTNAAIVGAMIGALHGPGPLGIPPHMAGPVLTFDCVAHDPRLTLVGHTRPATYRVADVMALLPNRALTHDKGSDV